MTVIKAILAYLAVALLWTILLPESTWGFGGLVALIVALWALKLARKQARNG